MLTISFFIAAAAAEACVPQRLTEPTAQSQQVRRVRADMTAANGATRTRLLEYNSGDAVTNTVRIWTERHQEAGRRVIEYSRFEDRWRSGDDTGAQSGKGTRLWWRAADRPSKFCRKTGNHDKRASSPRSMIRLRAPGTAGPSATIADLSWLEGSWIGHMPQGPVEHVILGPRLGHMPGFVRALGQGQVNFYEISLFAEAGGSLTNRVKHFTPALAGWEAQDGYVERRLVERDADNFYFDGITFSRTGRDSFTVYFLTRDGETEGETLVIPFRRAPQ